MSQIHRYITVILSGFSGAGKGAVSPQFLYYARSFHPIPTYTTRPPRPREDTGFKKYIRPSRDEFQSLLREGKLLEHSEHLGNFYGTPIAAKYPSSDQFIEVDCSGAMVLRAEIPNAHTVFLMTRTPEEQERRIRGRNSGETEEQIRERIKKARAEAALIGNYDYWLVNDDVHQTASQMLQLAMMLKFGNQPLDNVFRNQALRRSVQQAFGVGELATA